MGADGTTGTGTRRRVAAGEADAGDRLDRVIARALPELSRSRVKALIEAGHVALEPDRSPADRAADHAIDRGAATITEPSLRVKPGQAFAVFVPAAEEPVPRGEQIPLSVLYEDAELIVVDKPAGLVVHPAPGNPAGTLVNALIAHCGDTLAGVGGVKRPGIVHRLDKDTSGLMVAAKTDRAHA
ncbi:MAG: pseudouridine synthase, partial [Rhizobiaceae bacterium]